MNDKLLVFTLEDQTYAFALPVVDRVLRAIEVTRLPSAPGIVTGVINMQGKVVPVVSLRIRFGQQERGIEPSDQLIIVQTTKRYLAFVVDEVIGVVDYFDEDLTRMEDILIEADYVKGLVKFKKSMVLIADIETFLSLDEQIKLEVALK